jgi:hypothetical protein
MRVRLKVRFMVASAALLAAASAACGDPNAFQPITAGAKPWTPPAGWAPDEQCAVGYYVTIETCPGCTEPLSYALCTGVDFNQCVCGSPFTPGAICPNEFHCPPNDFPPQNWQEFTPYTGPGYAGNDPNFAGLLPPDAGASSQPEADAGGGGGD